MCTIYAHNLQNCVKVVASQRCRWLPYDALAKASVESDARASNTRQLRLHILSVCLPLTP